MNENCEIRDRKERILCEWETISKLRFPSASDKSRFALRDHLPQLIDALFDVMDTGKLVSPKAVSKIHGRQRFAFGDYTLTQVMGEYSILKNMIFDELKAKDGDSTETFRLVDHFFDEAVTTAASEFAKLREQELKSTVALLEASNSDLERFAGVAAHDLRSPASTIIGYAEVLSEGIAENPTLQKAAETIQRTGERMIQLIDQLLLYTKIGGSEIVVKDVSLEASVNDAVNTLEKSVKDASANVIVKALPHVSGDPILFTQLFQNLIANSLKFCAPNRTCEIVISGEIKGDVAIVKVRDNGIGFNPELKDMIFEPFKRAHAHLKIHGSGIGLATVQRIVSRHGGTIDASSIEGEGAEFVIQLPIKN